MCLASNWTFLTFSQTGSSNIIHIESALPVLCLRLIEYMLVNTAALCGYKPQPLALLCNLFI